MIRRIDRYISRELFVPLITGTIVIACLFAGNELIAVFKFLNAAALPAPTIFQLVLLRLPRWLIYTFPAGMAIGASLAIGRLARETEITALRASGVPIRRLLVPIFFWGLVTTGLNLWFAEKVQPEAAKSYKKVAQEAMVVSAQPTFKPNTVINLGKYNASLGSIERLNDGSLSLRDIFLFEKLGADEVMIWQAATGTYKDGYWKFPNAYVRWVKGKAASSFHTKDAVINEPITVHDLFSAPAPEELTAAEIAQTITEKRGRKEPTADLEVAYISHFAVPVSCVIFALTSAIVAVRFARKGPFVGLLMSLVLVALYYNLHVIATDIIGKQGYLPPVLAAWLPNAIYLVLGAVFYWGLE